ncbi:MAG: YihA family ribosome biogenesis GTP-binding protein [Clostridiales bacterium]|nr:YihA family ribosome biogenesis GTP-binding protein [Clostridiales bacterium]
MNYHNAKFIKSAAAPSDFISDGLPQVVFAGKSNVGKSSVINRLLNRKNFARVGATPGKTVHVNYFLIDGQIYFTDLPGYGYARVSAAEKQRWGKLMEAFFARPDAISLGVLIVDARHKPTQDDVLMAGWFLATGRPMIVAANKCDKLSASEKAACTDLISETLTLPAEIPVLLFSAEKGTNREALLKEIVDIAKR